MHKILLIVLTFLMLQGCASYFARGSDAPHANNVFPATQTDFRILGEKDNIVLGNEFKYIFILDIPFSLLTDILLLPYDVIMITLNDDDNAENIDTNIN